jgi:hypothetical protein
MHDRRSGVILIADDVDIGIIVLPDKQHILSLVGESTGGRHEFFV